jgi:hypothetical protein
VLSIRKAVAKLVDGITDGVDHAKQRVPTGAQLLELDTEAPAALSQVTKDAGTKIPRLLDYAAAFRSRRVEQRDCFCAS